MSAHMDAPPSPQAYTHDARRQSAWPQAMRTSEGKHLKNKQDVKRLSHRQRHGAVTHFVFVACRSFSGFSRVLFLFLCLRPLISLKLLFILSRAPSLYLAVSLLSLCLCLYISLYLSISLYIYIYIYISLYFLSLPLFFVISLCSCFSMNVSMAFPSLSISVYGDGSSIALSASPANGNITIHWCSLSLKMLKIETWLIIKRETTCVTLKGWEAHGGSYRREAICATNMVGKHTPA